ncbi:MAG: hydrogenase maturation protease [Candidatus Eremiobacteraeota bacterium]|nr:hydrogenase maturation protease [Candidatus Eremiobacteraeota bacterium]
MNEGNSSILIAGVGNIFFSDDGFGVEVARRLINESLPEGIKVADFGIRGVHLAYEMLAGYKQVVLVDAVPRGGSPGDLYLIEPELESAISTPDAHTMELQSVFAFMRTLGGDFPKITIVGCEPASCDEGIGLSEPVERAVTGAIQLIQSRIINRDNEEKLQCVELS